MFVDIVILLSAGLLMNPEKGAEFQEQVRRIRDNTGASYQLLHP